MRMSPIKMFILKLHKIKLKINQQLDLTTHHISWENQM